MKKRLGTVLLALLLCCVTLFSACDQAAPVSEPVPEATQKPEATKPPATPQPTAKPEPKQEKKPTSFTVDEKNKAAYAAAEAALPETTSRYSPPEVFHL